MCSSEDVLAFEPLRLVPSAVRDGQSEVPPKSLPQSTFKLGDFRKLYNKTFTAASYGIDQTDRPGLDSPALNGETRDAHVPLPSVSPATAKARLGDFSQIQLRLKGNVTDSNRVASEAKYAHIIDCSLKRAQNLPKRDDDDRTTPVQTVREGPQQDTIRLLKPRAVDPCEDALFAAKSPVSTGDIDVHQVGDQWECWRSIEDHATHTGQPSYLTMPGASRETASRFKVVLSYQEKGCGPMCAVSGGEPPSEKRLESLLWHLIPLRAKDVDVAARHYRSAHNGVHVFLDMSNINISFYQALKNKLSIQRSTRFMPLPQLNLQFLTEILVRSRKIVTLNAGCSTLPHRQEPKYICDLRRLGYRVDLRERRRTNQPKRWASDLGGGSASSSDEVLKGDSKNIIRYVEDLVDETLQTRIAESVMEFFDEQGILVIATGDAQPAKYSDGFLIYAERALRMGWHVEVVSWKVSLSSNWRKLEWQRKWREQFRIIYLDEYLEDLVTPQLNSYYA